MDDLLTPLDDVADVAWSAAVLDPATGRLLAFRHPDRVLPVASVGKLLLLLEVARQLASGRLDPDLPVRRTPEDEVGDSGLWQHLRSDSLPVEDVAVLVASVSDNVATNALLRTKTGTDSGVRGDVGLLAGHEGVRAYAVVASWAPGPGDPLRDAVLDAMRSVGVRLAGQAPPARRSSPE